MPYSHGFRHICASSDSEHKISPDSAFRVICRTSANVPKTVRIRHLATAESNRLKRHLKLIFLSTIKFTNFSAEVSQDKGTVKRFSMFSLQDVLWAQVDKGVQFYWNWKYIWVHVSCNNFRPVFTGFQRFLLRIVDLSAEITPFETEMLNNISEPYGYQIWGV